MIKVMVVVMRVMVLIVMMELVVAVMMEVVREGGSVRVNSNGHYHFPLLISLLLLLLLWKQLRVVVSDGGCGGGDRLEGQWYHW